MKKSFSYNKIQRDVLTSFGINEVVLYVFRKVRYIKSNNWLYSPIVALFSWGEE